MEIDEFKTKLLELLQRDAQDPVDDEVFWELVNELHHTADLALSNARSDAVIEALRLDRVRGDGVATEFAAYRAATERAWRDAVYRTAQLRVKLGWTR